MIFGKAENNENKETPGITFGFRNRHGSLRLNPKFLEIFLRERLSGSERKPNFN